MTESEIAKELTNEVLANFLLDGSYSTAVKDVHPVYEGATLTLQFVHDAKQMRTAAEMHAPRAPWLAIKLFTGFTSEANLRDWCLKADFMSAELFEQSIRDLRHQVPTEKLDRARAKAEEKRLQDDIRKHIEGQKRHF